MKTQIKQIKTLQLILAVFVSLSFYGQTEIKDKSLFLRVYNLEGKKIGKGLIISVNDTLLELKNYSKYEKLIMSNIGFIKTKRSAGHNLFIGTAVGAATGALLGAATAEPDAWIMGYTVAEGLAGGAILGAAAGAAIGGISVAFKTSDTYIIDGELRKWEIFKEMVAKTK